jgi:hypothetical protein
MVALAAIATAKVSLSPRTVNHIVTIPRIFGLRNGDNPIPPLRGQTTDILSCMVSPHWVPGHCGPYPMWDLIFISNSDLWFTKTQQNVPTAERVTILHCGRDAQEGIIMWLLRMRQTQNNQPLLRSSN